MKDLKLRKYNSLKLLQSPHLEEAEPATAVSSLVDAARDAVSKDEGSSGLKHCKALLDRGTALVLRDVATLLLGKRANGLIPSS